MSILSLLESADKSPAFLELITETNWPYVWSIASAVRYYSGPLKTQNEHEI
jgi:hypothetical protein